MTEYLRVNPAQARALAMCLASSQAHDMLVQAAQRVEACRVRGYTAYVHVSKDLALRVSLDVEA